MNNTDYLFSSAPVGVLNTVGSQWTLHRQMCLEAKVKRQTEDVSELDKGLTVKLGWLGHSISNNTALVGRTVGSDMATAH